MQQVPHGKYDVVMVVCWQTMGSEGCESEDIVPISSRVNNSPAGFAGIAANCSGLSVIR